MRVGIIGAGNVGSTLACRIAEENLADVILLDIIDSLAKGKAEDINDSLSVIKSERRVWGTSDYKSLKGSSVIVITAGLARQPGMSREQLLEANLKIIKGVSKNISLCCRNPIVIVVTNPLDIMTYVVLKETGYPKNRVFGMAGALDCARLINSISTVLHISPSRITPSIIGSHSDDMVILKKLTRISGRPISSVIKQDKLSKIIRQTKKRGAFIVSLLGRGSAYFAPSQAIASMLRAIIKGKKEKIYASCYLEGEYGLNDICIGVPAIIGKNGIERIIELVLEKEERVQFLNSVEKLKKTIETLRGISYV